MTISIDIDTYLEDWRRREAGEGGFFYDTESGNACFIAAADLEADNRAQEAWSKLPEPERAIATHTPHVYGLLRSIEPRLTGETWTYLKQSNPLLYGRVIFGVWSSPDNLALIESVVAELATKKMTLSDLPTLHRLDESLLVSPRSYLDQAARHLRLADRMDRRFQDHVRTLEAAISEDACGTPGFKEASRLELDKVRSFLEKYRLDLEEQSAAYRARAQEMHETVADTDQLHPNIDTEQRRPSTVLTAVMSGLADDLRTAGFSPRKSFILTDKLTHFFFPHFWEAPTRDSYKKVRLRLTELDKKTDHDRTP